MALTPAKLDSIAALAAAAANPRASVAELRRQHPGVSFTCCDASDMSADLEPYQSHSGFDLYLVNGSGHCWDLTADIQAATGVLIARTPHHPPTADVEPLAVEGRTPSNRLDVVTTTPAPSSGPCTPPQRRLNALATKSGEECGLAEHRHG